MEAVQEAMNGGLFDVAQSPTQLAARHIKLEEPKSKLAAHHFPE